MTTSDTPRLPQLEIDEFWLPNGLRVLLHRDAAVPVVTVHLLYAVGSKHEKPQRTGFAHLFEHLLFQGSEHVADDEHFSLIQQRGGVANGNTWFDRTVYYETLPARELELALWLESDRMGFFEKSITQDKLDGQRDVVKNERRWRVDNQPYGTWLERAQELVFPADFPYHWPVIGYMEDLDRASLEDVREFFRSHYRPNNATLVVAGDFEPEQTRELVHRYFSEIPSGSEPERLVTHWQPLAWERRVEVEDDVQLARVFAVYPVPPWGSDHYYGLDLASDLLGYGRASRLNRRLVHETGLATDVSVFNVPALEAGLFVVMATVAPDAEPARVEALIDQELERLAREPAPADELQRVLNRIDARMLHDFETAERKADMLNMFTLAHGDPRRVNTDLEHYHAVPREQLSELAGSWLQPSNRAVLSYLPRRQRATIQTPEASIERGSAPGSGQQRGYSAPGFTRHRLDNGLELVMARLERVPLTSLSVILDAGSSRDPQGQEGVASLTADLLDEGTSKHSAMELAEALDALGASLHCDAIPDAAELSLDSLTRQLDPALELLVETLREPSFPERELERVKREQRARILQDRDTPGSRADLTFLARVYSGHPYGHPVDGSEQSLAGLDRELVRSFYQRHLQPGAATLVAVGDFDPEQLTRRCEQLLADWQPQPAPVSLPAAEPGSEPLRVTLVDKPGAPQSEVRVGRLALARKDPDWVSAQVLNGILGGKFTSRINLNLREEHGYTYGAHSGYDGRRGLGSFVVSSAVNAPATAPAIREILKELERIRSEPVSRDELEDTRNYLAGVFPLRLERAAQLAGMIAELRLFGLPEDSFDRYCERVMAVTTEDVLRVAQRTLEPVGMEIVVVGPAAELERELAELGPVTRID